MQQHIACIEDRGQWFGINIATTNWKININKFVEFTNVAFLRYSITWKQPYISKYRFGLLLFTCPITFISLRHVNAIWHRKYRSTVVHAMACCPRIQKVCPKICGLMKWVSWDWLICVNPGANEMIIMHLKSKLQLNSNSPLKTLCCWNESLCDKI